MAADAKPIQVFISYSHDSDEHKERVRRLSDRLRSDGVDCWIDRYMTGPAEGWYGWIRGQFLGADFVLVVCTPEYCRRFSGGSGDRTGQGVALESALILAELYPQGMSSERLLPILFDDAGLEQIPHELRTFSHFRLDDDYEKLLRHLLDKPEVPVPPLGPEPALPQLEPAWTDPRDATRPRIDVGRLPSTILEKLIGRDGELEQLDEAWEDPTVGVFEIVAVGGAGKTALVHHWLQRFEPDGWQELGAEVVFAWSFYSQGGGDDRQASGDAFIDDALSFLGVTERPTSARDRGLLLADQVRRQRALLVLDGLEPLQHPLGTAQEGRVKDPAVAALLKALTSDNPGLVVVTTREPVAELASRRGGSVRSLDLEKLSPAAGAALLGWLEVKGPEKELRAVSEEVHGHAFTLTLVGTFLRDAHSGDVRAWRDVPLLEAAALIDNEKAARLMAAYADGFDEEYAKPPAGFWARLRRRSSDPVHSPERQLLSLLGLFDRPAEADAVTALRRRPAIPGLTDRLVELPAARWNVALERLRRARLLLEPEATTLATEVPVLDAHPLVREQFAAVLKTDFKEAYRAGHQRLYEHYATVADELPETLEGMQPLYLAIGHGCRAGRRQEVFDEIYQRRVRRKEERFSIYKLGAFGAELTALAGFFDRSWGRPSRELRPADRAWLLNTAGFCLRALGRLVEAVEPMAAGLELRIEMEAWENAARVASNLSELTLTVGRVGEAVEHGRRAVELAERSGDLFQRAVDLAVLGEALHAAGDLDGAAAAFRDAEELQVEHQPHFPKLYSLQGYRYCDLLLGRSAPLDGSALRRKLLDVDAAARRGYEEVRDRGRYMVEEHSNLALLSVALHHLSLGRALLGLALADGDGLDGAVEPLQEAVRGLRNAGTEHHLPRGLLARAMLHRFRGDGAAVRVDLEEALEVAERGAMRLHECDAHLEWARLCFDEGDAASSRRHLEKARELVAATGYHRRDREVAELTAALGGEG